MKILGYLFYYFVIVVGLVVFGFSSFYLSICMVSGGGLQACTYEIPKVIFY